MYGIGQVLSNGRCGRIALRDAGPGTEGDEDGNFQSPDGHRLRAFGSRPILEVIWLTLTAKSCLVHLHIARAGVNGNRGAAAAHFANHALSIFSNLSLDGGCHGMAQRHTSGTRRDINIKRRVRRHVQRDVSGARPNAPHILRQAFAVNISAARLGMKSAIDAAYGDVARARAYVDIASAQLLDLNITAARFNPSGARKVASADIPRSRLKTHFASESLQLQIARSTLEIDVAL